MTTDAEDAAYYAEDAAHYAALTMADLVRDTRADYVANSRTYANEAQCTS